MFSCTPGVSIFPLRRVIQSSWHCCTKINTCLPRHAHFLFCPPHSGALYHGLDERDAQMDNALERALAQAENDATFRKVKRMSYSSNAAGEVRNILHRCQYFADYQISLELIYKYFINTLFHSYFIHIPYQLTLLYYYYILYYLFIKNL